MDKKDIQVGINTHVFVIADDLSKGSRYFFRVMLPSCGNWERRGCARDRDNGMMLCDIPKHLWFIEVPTQQVVDKIL
ncbi:MAG: hypothetical protein R2794_12755 [Chitinophagales bacterium]